MENTPMSHADYRIAAGIAGLKAESMPAPPVGLATEIIAAECPVPRRLGGRTWALAACTCLAIAAFGLMPQRSAAAASIGKLVTEYSKADVLFHVTPFWVEGKKRTPKIWSGYVKGERWHYVQSNYEQASDGKRVVAYWPSEGIARSWETSASDNDARSVLASADLRWWQSPDRRGLTLDHDVSWNGRKVDRYSITTYSKAWGETRNTLYADPVANRPLYAEYLHASGNGSAMQWDYPTEVADSILTLKMKPGTKVIDVTAEVRKNATKSKEAAKVAN